MNDLSGATFLLPVPGMPITRQLWWSIATSDWRTSLGLHRVHHGQKAGECFQNRPHVRFANDGSVVLKIFKLSTNCKSAWGPDAYRRRNLLVHFGQSSAPIHN
jgi:hypothetical protein